MIAQKLLVTLYLLPVYQGSEAVDVPGNEAAAVADADAVVVEIAFGVDVAVVVVVVALSCDSVQHCDAVGGVVAGVVVVDVAAVGGGVYESRGPKNQNDPNQYNDN